MMPALIPIFILLFAIILGYLCRDDDAIFTVCLLAGAFSAMAMFVLAMMPAGTPKYETVIPKHIMKDAYCVSVILEDKSIIYSTDTYIVNNELEQLEVIKTIPHNGYDMPLSPTYKITVKSNK